MLSCPAELYCPSNESCVHVRFKSAILKKQNIENRPMGSFVRYVGIDYSGAATPEAGLSGLQVYVTDQARGTHSVHASGEQEKRKRRWSRQTVFEWLCEEIAERGPSLIGVDHAFGFPESYLDRYRLRSWQHFLRDFVQAWPTHEAEQTVEVVRQQQRGDGKRIGTPTELRLTERWTTSAKSVFQFDVQGQVAKSTHAGLPWLYRLQKKFRDRLHCWPFDGWEIPPGKSVIAEVYPSLTRKRYDRGPRTVDQQDAYSVSRWLAEMDCREELTRFLRPPLSRAEMRLARREGWILGVC